MTNPQHILVAGGTGFIGNTLLAEAKRRNIKVTLVTRDPNQAKREFPDANAIAWKDLGPTSFEGIDAVVNLAGAGIADKRWSAERIKLLETSRTETTKQLIDALNAAETKPAVLVQSSATGFYGDTKAAVDEDSPAGGSGVLPKICVEWENAAKASPIRTVYLRTGVVLGHGGGALEKMAQPFKMFLGAPLGSGKQYMAWVHIDDIVGLVFHAIENDALSGPVNGVAPNPVTNREFSKALGRALKRPCMPIGVPGFMMKLLVGGMAEELLLASQQVYPKKASDYSYRFAKIDDALAALYPRK